MMADTGDLETAKDAMKHDLKWKSWRYRFDEKILPTFKKMFADLK